MDATAIFKISYGLFFVGSKAGDAAGICVINTAMQVTQEPLRISVAMTKGGYTQGLIEKSGQLSLGVLGQEAALADIAHFGQQSGKDTDKLAGKAISTDSLGNPVYEAGCIALLTARVIQTVDVGTHIIFIADVVDAKNLSDAPPMTYADYRALKSGKQPAAAAGSEAAAQWQCSICHYVYDGEIPFEQLPEDWVCPVCGRGKDVFVKQ